jgi:hypothetical protein
VGLAWPSILKIWHRQKGLVDLKPEKIKNATTALYLWLWRRFGLIVDSTQANRGAQFFWKYSRALRRSMSDFVRGSRLQANLID